MTPELTEADALVMAAECPVIRAAYASGEEKVIKRAEKDHPPSRCIYVKNAAKKASEEGEEK